MPLPKHISVALYSRVGRKGEDILLELNIFSLFLHFGFCDTAIASSFAKVGGALSP